MQLYQLEQFYTLAQYEHMTRAAEHLHISQPALSQSIHRLEEELGVPLFERKGRKVVLNNFGIEYLKCVESVFLKLDDGRKILNDMKSAENCRVRLADMGATSITGNILRMYSQDHPDVSLEYIVQSEPEIKRLLRAGSLDLALATSPFKESDFNWTPLGLLGLELLVPEDSPYEDESSVPLKDFSHLRFIGPAHPSEVRFIFESACFRNNFVPHFAYESNDMSLMLELTANHNGVLYTLNGKTPQLQNCNHQTIRSVGLKRLHIKDFNDSLPLGIITLKAHYLSATILEFIDFTANLFQFPSEE